MNYRYMRIIVMFDLPVETTLQRRKYRMFRQYLIRYGFVMMQESVYSKLVLNSTAAGEVIASLRDNRPPEGLVQILTVTEKQFSRMEILVGEVKSDVIDTDERFVVI